MIHPNQKYLKLDKNSDLFPKRRDGEIKFLSIEFKRFKLKRFLSTVLTLLASFFIMLVNDSLFFTKQYFSPA